MKIHCERCHQAVKQNHLQNHLSRCLGLISKQTNDIPSEFRFLLYCPRSKAIQKLFSFILGSEINIVSLFTSPCYTLQCIAQLRQVLGMPNPISMPQDASLPLLSPQILQVVSQIRRKQQEKHLHQEQGLYEAFRSWFDHSYTYSRRPWWLIDVGGGHGALGYVLGQSVRGCEGIVVIDLESHPNPVERFAREVSEPSFGSVLHRICSDISSIPLDADFPAPKSSDWYFVCKHLCGCGISCVYYVTSCVH
jgi:hypothetical protein